MMINTSPTSTRIFGSKIKSDILKMIANGDLESVIDSTYLLDDKIQLVNDENCVNKDDSVLSILTDHSITVTEAKQSPD
ncbi:nucleolar protein NOP2 [Histoplasma capsulatum var. duboisii H88]|uniref:Nucleolar protein NOP2 n=1 Tax=Ajellomyces capsulatus (strain H88) TaxID=544711 RepID=F0U5T1_AJEC8|nr:nucleolar protein NOP2 [Histoplasma capsulatum var. duboisii H88]